MADEVVEALRTGLSDEEVLELTYITSLYLMHGIMSRALRTEFDDHPDATVEVPAPPAFDPRSMLPDRGDDQGLDEG